MPKRHQPSRQTVAVDGGELSFEVHGPAGGIPVVGAPGLTSYAAVWHQMIDALPGTHFVAVDLRGRGGSRDLPGPSSIAQHAEDIDRLVDALGFDRFIFAGHSLGAFVATEYAATHADRLAGLILVDGGVAFPPSEMPVDPDTKATAELEAIVARLARRFTSAEEYHAFWKAHPGIGPYWSDAIAAYVEADLLGEAPGLYPSAIAERVIEDLQDLHGGGRRDPFASLSTPAIILRAPRGISDQPEALYPQGYLQEVAAAQPLLRVWEVDDVNHYTVLLGSAGAARAAEATRTLSEEFHA